MLSEVAKLVVAVTVAVQLAVNSDWRCAVILLNGSLKNGQNHINRVGGWVRFNETEDRQRLERALRDLAGCSHLLAVLLLL